MFAESVVIVIYDSSSLRVPLPSMVSPSVHVVKGQCPFEVVPVGRAI